MISLNKVMVMGNLGNEVEMRFTPTGTEVSTFRVAANSKFTNSRGETREETEWFSVVTWSKLAELCNQYLHKGSRVYVEGRNKTRSWDGQDGQKHYRTEVIASRVIFLDSPHGKEAVGEAPDASETDGGVVPDDIPF